MPIKEPGINNIEEFSSKKEGEHNEMIKPLFRGVWADFLENNDTIFVGGFLAELTMKIRLDFEFFSSDLDGFKQHVEDEYKKSKEKMEKWINDEVKADIDPYLFFVCARVQQKVENLLEVKNSQGNHKMRNDNFSEKEIPNLSDFKKSAKCAERAALGQHIMQLLNIDSSYVGGGIMVDYEDEEGENEDHSFIVIRPKENVDKTVVFDIARPRSVRHFPRLSNTDIPLTYELLENKDDLLVRSTEVLQGGVSYYGIGDQMFGKHNIIEKNETK